MKVRWKEAVVAELRHYSSLPIRTEATHIQRKDHKGLQPWFKPVLTEYSSDGLNQLSRWGFFKLSTWQDTLVEEVFQDGIFKDLYGRRIDCLKWQELVLKSLNYALLPKCQWFSKNYSQTLANCRTSKLFLGTKFQAGNGLHCSAVFSTPGHAQCITPSEWFVVVGT